MQKIWNKYVNLGISEDLNIYEISQVRMVNFTALFVIVAGIAFFIQSLEVGSLILSTALITSPFFFSIVLVCNAYFKRKLARNLLFFGMCLEIGLYSLIENPSSFTVNYFFGIAMLSFVVYNKPLNRILGLFLCIILYFGLGYISPYFQNKLPFDPIIYVMDVLTLFFGILLCLNYFQKITKTQMDIIMNQKIELEKININKTKLISIITHDIRNPINNLNLILGLQNEETFNKEDLNYILNRVRKEFVNQFESIENLLKWSQNQLTEINVKSESVEVDHVIMSIIQELNYTISDKGINLGMSICGEDLIIIDKTHLNIILRNLLNNAIKFTNAGGNINIITSRKEDYYNIDIVDDGIGFEIIGNVEFEPFEYSTQQIGTNKEKGNGLGLIICKELAEKNNAILLVKNNKDFGSTVRLQIKTM